MLNPIERRKDFPMYAAATRERRELHYLDSAASAQTPLSVLNAMDGYYREYRANVHRGMYPASARATEEFENAREKVARFLGAEPREIVFTRGATESLNLVAYSLARGLSSGDEVVITMMEHHANFVPWQQLAKQYGFALKIIPLAADGCSLDMEAAARLIGPKTRVVSFMHVSNALGTVNPVRDLVAMARGVGAKVIIDAAQTVGHRPLDVRQLDCDFLAFSGHKTYGPTGIGALYGKRAELEALPPFMYGGEMIIEVTAEDSRWNDLPWKFEPGTPNVAGAIGLGAAVDYVQAVGAEEIHEHERRIVTLAMERLAEIPGIRLFGPPTGADRGGVVSFAVEGTHPHDLSDLLGRDGVCVRGGHHCAMPLMRALGVSGTTRASFGIYSDEADVEALVAAVRKAKGVLRG